MTQLIQDAKNDICSLAIFKPTKILDFIIKPTTKEWRLDQIETMRAQISQLTLFEADQRDFKEMPKLPYKFSYKFTDDKGRQSTLMIEDWEIGQLYWNCIKNHDEKTALRKVREKYLDDFAITKDLYFIPRHHIPISLYRYQSFSHNWNFSSTSYYSKHTFLNLFRKISWASRMKPNLFIYFL